MEYWQFVVMQCFHFTCFVESLYVVQETSYPEDFAKPASMDRSHVTSKSVHRVRNVLAGLLLSHSRLIQFLPNLLILSSHADVPKINPFPKPVLWLQARCENFAAGSPHLHS